MRDYKKIEADLVEFLRNYAHKSGVKNLLLGVSGGLDSAVVATLCAKALPFNSHALLMPADSSNPTNLNHAIKLCEKLKINFKILNIQNVIDAYAGTIGENLSPVRLGNLCARARMSLLYDYSASIGALVVGTSNKSELTLGYGTIFGDTACAINPIGGLYKTEIFEFAKFLKIDEEIINKAPSADLWQGQSDEAEIGYSYEKIDEILKALENFGRDKDERILNTLDQTALNEISKRVKANEFKRRMPAIAQIKG